MVMPESRGVGGLKWVKGELIDSLRRVRGQLESFVASDGQAECGDAITALYEVRGVLLALQMTAPARLAEEMQRLLERLVAHSLANPDEAAEALMLALIQLPHYLDRVESGHPESPVSLLPSINDLRVSRATRTLSAAELLVPSSVLAELETPTPEALQAMASVATKIRPHFHRYLLQAFQGDGDQGLIGLGRLFNQLHRFFKDGVFCDAFRASEAMVGAILEGALPISPATKAAMGHVDSVFKAVLDTTPSWPEPQARHLIEEMLNYLTDLDPEAPLVQELTAIYRAPAEVEEEEEEAGGPSAQGKDALASLAGEVLRELAVIKDRVDLYVRGGSEGPEQLASIEGALRQLANTLAIGEDADLVGRLHHLADDIGGVARGRTQADDTFLLGFAQDLLAAEDALRLAAPASEGGTRSGDALLNVTLREARADLAKAKQAIADFALDSGNQRRLRDAPEVLPGVAAALHMLGEDPAAEVIDGVTQVLRRRFVDGGHLPDAAELDLLAEAISGVDLYMEGLGQGASFGDRLLSQAHTAMDLLGAAGPVPVAEATPMPPPRRMSEAWTPPAAIAPVEPPSPPPESEGAPAPQIDPEFLDVFLEEAREEQVRIEETLAVWIDDPSDLESLTVLRRSFHTLKGSGRLVGAARMADLAAGTETLLDRVLTGALPAAEAVLGQIAAVAAVLPGLIEAEAEARPIDLAPLLRTTAEILAAPASDFAPKPAPKPVAAETPGPAAGEETVEADLELLDIFATEASEHLATLREFLGRAGQGAALKPELGMLRALHTLCGSARMTGIESVAGVSSALERLCGDFDARGMQVDRPLMDLLERACDGISARLDRLPESGPEVADLAAAAAEALAWRERLATAGPAPVWEPERGMAALPEAKPGLAELDALEIETPAAPAGGEGPVPAGWPEELLPDLAAAAAWFEDEAAAPVEAEAEPEESVVLEAGALLVEAPEEAEAEPVAFEVPPEREAEVVAFEVPVEPETEPLAFEVPVELEAEAVLFEAPEEREAEPVAFEAPAELEAEPVAFEAPAELEAEPVAFEAPVELEAELVAFEAPIELAAEPIAFAAPEVPEPEPVAFEAPVEMEAEPVAFEALEEPEPVVFEAPPEPEPEPAVLAPQIQPEPAPVTGPRPAVPVPERVGALAAAAQAPQAEGPDAELAALFLEDARDILDGLDRRLREWQLAPQATAPLQGIQRLLHTLKGSARLAGLAVIGNLSHALESTLSPIAQGDLAVSDDALELTQRSVDTLSSQIDALEQGAEIPAADDLVVALSGALAPATPGEVADLARLAPSPTEAAAPTVPEVAAAPAARAPAPAAAQIRVRADLLNRLVNNSGEISIYRARLAQQNGTLGYSLAELDQTVGRLREQLRQLDIETEAQILYRFDREASEAAPSVRDFDPLELDRFSTLQQLSRSIAETVNDLVSLKTLLADMQRESADLLVQQARIADDLQDGLLRTRMVPFVQVVPRLHRVVRQTAQALGKRATLEIRGPEVELDRSILDRLGGPLEHLLRNAVAHGIESPAQRAAAGKEAAGVVQLVLSREGNDVVIGLSDDGAGMNLDAIRRRAMERGLLRDGLAATEEELLHLAMEPGFSTVDQVTQIAGRGVGLDVVASEIKRLSGTVTLTSTPGQGTTITLRLPLTLAVIDALLVTAGDSTYAIPHASIAAVTRIPRADLDLYYRGQGGDFTHLGEDYRILHLEGLLYPGATPDLGERRWLPVLLVQTADQRFALQVDSLIGTQRIVVKPLGPQLSAVRWLNGGTILPDGRVAMIVDLVALARSPAVHAYRLAVARLVEEERHQACVMVVDDSLTVRRVTGRLLKRQGMEVLTAKDGVEALTLLEERIPDLILLDIEMPRMDGYELTRHIRRSPKFEAIPIIMITSRTGEKHRQVAMELGVNRYLGKPYQEAELLDEISAVLMEGPT